MRATIWKPKKLKKEKNTLHISGLWLKEIIIYGLPQVGKYLILHKFPWGQRTHVIRKKWAKISFQVRSVLFSQTILISAQNFKLPDAGFLFPFIPSETLRVFLKLFSIPLRNRNQRYISEEVVDEKKTFFSNTMSAFKWRSKVE